MFRVGRVVLYEDGCMCSENKVLCSRKLLFLWWKLPQPVNNIRFAFAVQTVKHLLKKAQDPYRALLAYRPTPLESGLCPAELLMGRKIRTQVPTVPAQLMPSWHPILWKLKSYPRQKTSATLQRPSQTSPLENVFGYRTRGSKGQFWTMLAPHGLTQ